MQNNKEWSNQLNNLSEVGFKIKLQHVQLQDSQNCAPLRPADIKPGWISAKLPVL
jgi:hypothetical protein